MVRYTINQRMKNKVIDFNCVYKDTVERAHNPGPNMAASASHPRQHYFRDKGSDVTEMTL
jgi:hypothetical protein